MTERESELLEASNGAHEPDPFPEAPDVETDMAAGFDATVPVITPPEPGPANPSPDGSQIAYLQRDAAGTLTIWLSPIDGGEPRALSTSIDLIDMPEGPQWSPDGSLLAVTGGHPADLRTAIWIVNVERSEPRLLVNHAGADHSPRWSPDGELIAFVSQRDGRDGISVAGIDGTGPSVPLTSGHPGQDDHDPCWSSEGTKIGFARRTLEGDSIGDHIWTANILTGESKQVTKRLAKRRQLTWAPDRALILHITDDGEWENVAVVNPDNSAGWNIASEAGDKSEPRYSHDGQRVVYSRSKDGVSRACERAASSASAETIDPGVGAVYSTRFLPDKRVLYAHRPATGASRFYVQEPKADAERVEFPRAVGWSADRELISPTQSEFDINGRKLGGLMYRMNEISGPAPAVIYLPDRPDRRREARFDATAMALAGAGLAVFVPTLPGTPGYGKKITQGLKEAHATESEALDLIAIRAEMAKLEGVDQGRIAIVGRGHGGAISLIAAGSRPGQFQAVVAIDPVTDWDYEVDNADSEYRAWLIRTFGVPASNRGVYALRTPSTFVGVIDVPILLIGTDQAPESRSAQLDELISDLQELEVGYEHEIALAETEWETAMKVAAFLRRALTAVHSIVDDRAEQVMDSATV